MKNPPHRLLLVLGIAMALLRPAAAASIGPASLGEGIFNAAFDRHGVIPTCDHPRVEGKIKSRFRRYAARHMLERDLRIEAFRQIRQARYEIAMPSPLARRYCRAKAKFDDGRTRRIYYFIEEQAGFAGIGWNVEFCVSGLDPWRIYNGFCRVARPQ